MTIKFLQKLKTIILVSILSFTGSFAFSETLPLETAEARYFLGSVEVTISNRPVKTIQTPCYVQVENLLVSAGSATENLSPEINVQAYLTLTHLVDGPEADENGFEWVTVESRKALLMAAKDKIPFYRYRASEPASKEPIRDLTLLLDSALQPNLFGVQVQHGNHGDNLLCMDLVEQKTSGEIDAFLDATQILFSEHDDHSHEH